MIHSYEIDYLISKAIESERYEIQVILMKYKDEIGGYNETVDSAERFKL